MGGGVKPPSQIRSVFRIDSTKIVLNTKKK